MILMIIYLIYATLIIKNTNYLPIIANRYLLLTIANLAGYFLTS